MRSLTLFILLIPLLSWAEGSPKIISIKEYNPQQKYEGRICIVDLYGEMECKEDPKKQLEKNPEPKKTLESLKPTDPLSPGPNEGWEGAIMVNGVGSFNGVGLAIEKRNGHWAYGSSFKFNMYSASVNDESSALEMMGLVTASYYLIPRWYAYSTKKTFDLSVNIQAGYNMVSKSESSRKSDPVMGMGAKISYPVSDAFRIQTGVDIYQNFSLKSVGSSGYIGIGFNF